MKNIKAIVAIVVAVFVLWYLNRSREFKEAVESNNAAKIKLESQQFEEAFALLGRARRLGGHDSEFMAVVAHNQAMAYFGLGREKFREKAFKAALPLLQKAAKASRRIAREHAAWFYIGECYRGVTPKNIENTRKAIAAYEKALIDSPDNDDVLLALETMRARLEALPLREKALSAFRSGKFDEAGLILHKFIEKPALLRDFDDIYPRYGLALIEFENGHGQEALQFLSQSEDSKEGGDSFQPKRDLLRNKIIEKYPELKGQEHKSQFDSLFD